MDTVTRKKMGDQAVALAKSCGYTTTGTVEFLMDPNKDFYFLEMNTRLQVEHPITEEITGIDLVEQQILISAGYEMKMRQNDVKINGHSVEYRVYTEDPSRKFLPSIGFLKKYKEPRAHENIRIDTGVQEGSEISMYYDPMISKLITWGKDRKEALDLIDHAFDEYVIQGVTHNLGFGKSIVANESFREGDYSTAFIPKFYPEGYHGDKLNNADMEALSLTAFNLKNHFISKEHLQGQDAPEQAKTLYVTVRGKGDEEDKDWKVSLNSEGIYEVTDMATGESNIIKSSLFDFEYNSLVRLNVNDNSEILQLLGQTNNLDYSFYFRNGKVDCTVYDEHQFKYKNHMAPPKKIDLGKSVISPMPGSIISVSVEPGQTVSEGQELIVIEAMKMQNIIKSEREGKIKSVSCKAGDSVTVDALLIEFE